MIFNIDKLNCTIKENNLTNFYCNLVTDYYDTLGFKLLSLDEYVQVFDDSLKTDVSYLIEDTDIEAGLTVKNIDESEVYIKGKGYFTVKSKDIIKEFLLTLGVGYVVVRAEVDNKEIYSVITMDTMFQFGYEFLEKKITGVFTTKALEHYSEQHIEMCSKMAPIYDVSFSNTYYRITKEEFDYMLELYEQFKVPVTDSWSTRNSQLDLLNRMEDKRYIILDEIAVMNSVNTWHAEYLNAMSAEANKDFRCFILGDTFVFRDGTILGEDDEDVLMFLELADV